MVGNFSDWFIIADNNSLAKPSMTLENVERIVNAAINKALNKQAE